MLLPHFGPCWKGKKTRKPALNDVRFSSRCRLRLKAHGLPVGPIILARVPPGTRPRARGELSVGHDSHRTMACHAGKTDPFCRKMTNIIFQHGFDPGTSLTMPSGPFQPVSGWNGHGHRSQVGWVPGRSCPPPCMRAVRTGTHAVGRLTA